MVLNVLNCNNISTGRICIVDGTLNIKYAVNGTGKSTIAKAIKAVANNNSTALSELKPYMYQSENDDTHTPSISGITDINKVMIFDESYISQYVYQSNDLLKNSFEIFVKTPDYDKHIEQIHYLLNDIRKAFQENPEIDDLITVFSQFLDGCGKSQTGLAASGSIIKGLGKGNKLNNIPHELEAFRPYLINTNSASNVKWLKWQSDGREYLDMADQCPYCSGSVENTKKNILRISEEYDSKAVEHLNKIVNVFEQLHPYFSETTNKTINEIINNASNMSNAQKNFLYEIKNQVLNIKEQLVNLKNIGFQTLKDVDEMTEQIKRYMIDIELYSHLQSELMRGKIAAINNSINTVLRMAGRLQGEINQQNELIHRTIEENSNTINDFLKCAGYKYEIGIEETPNKDYRLLLKPCGLDTEVIPKEHLSYGEKNALALALFMFSAVKENPDLVILDDPISSFDGNKRYALINMLFMSEKCLRNRTVLLLTHDFNSVIDLIHTMHFNINPAPQASFMCTNNGVLVEKNIKKRDIKSLRQITIENLHEDIDNLNKIVYLRRLLEIEGENSLAWNLLSNIVHKREIPTITINNMNRDMLEEEIVEASCKIKEYIPDFDYLTEYKKTQDQSLMKKLYNKSASNYEKLQIYRILYNEKIRNPVIKKYINEIFHIENDYLFQLNPREYDNIPQFIIEECNADIDTVVMIGD